MAEKRKRGWPKGKPRKVDHVVASPILDGNKYGVKVHNDSGPTFPPGKPLDFDIATLGTRIVTNMVEKPVVVGQTDLGSDIITMKMRPVTVTKLQPILNLEETLSLGKRDWQPFPPKEGHWFCHVEQKGQHRRFLIPEEIYQKVKDA